MQQPDPYVVQQIYETSKGFRVRYVDRRQIGEIGDRIPGTPVEEGWDEFMDSLAAEVAEDIAEGMFLDDCREAFKAAETAMEQWTRRRLRWKQPAPKWAAQPKRRCPVRKRSTKQASAHKKQQRRKFHA